MKDSLGYEYYDPSNVVRKLKVKKNRKSGIKNRLVPDFVVNGEEFYVCHYCKETFGYDLITVDHKVPISKGGTHEIENLLSSCRKCNNKKGDMDYDKYLKTISIN